LAAILSSMADPQDQLVVGGRWLNKPNPSAGFAGSQDLDRPVVYALRGLSALAFRILVIPSHAVEKQDRAVGRGAPVLPGPVHRKNLTVKMALNSQSQSAGLSTFGEGGAAWTQLPDPDGVTAAPTRSARQRQQENDPHVQTMQRAAGENKKERVVVGCYTFCIALKISDIL